MVLLASGCSHSPPPIYSSIDQCGGYIIKHTGGQIAGGVMVSVRALVPVKSVAITVDMVVSSGSAVPEISGTLTDIAAGESKSIRLVFPGPAPVGGWLQRASCELHIGSVVKQ